MLLLALLDKEVELSSKADDDKAEDNMRHAVLPASEFLSHNLVVDLRL